MLTFLILDNGSTLLAAYPSPHLVDGVEEAPVEISESHRHVPRVDAEET